MLTPRQRAAALTAAYYSAIFLAFGAHLPYWPVWLDDWGLSAGEIGYFLGAATLAKIAGSTLLPAIGDRFAIRRVLVAATALGAAALVLAHLTIGNQSLLFAATLVMAFLIAPVLPLGEALGLRASERHGFAYAPVRAVGSVAFLVANIAVGAWIGQAGPDVVVWVLAAGLIGAAVIGWHHPGGGAAAVRGADRASNADLRALARSPVFILFTLTVALGQGAHGVYYVYSALDWQADGITPGVVGWLWAVGVLAETALLLGPGRAWVARLGPSRALGLAALAGILRWACMAAGPGSLWLWPLQMLHAMTFALAHLGAMAFIAAAVPPRLAGSAQGVLTGVIGGSVSAGAMFVAAGMTQTWGTGTAYGMAAVMAAGSAALAVALGRVWSPDRPLVMT